MNVKEFFKKDKKRLIVLPILAALVILFLVLGTVFGIKSCTSVDGLVLRKTSDVNAYGNTTQVGASYSEIGTVERYRPIKDVRDGGLSTGYPVYGKTLTLTGEQKSAILAENRTILASTGTFNRMDGEGYLYLDDRPYKDASGEHVRIYQHTGSVGLYYGNVADDEPGVVKGMTFRHRTYSSYYEVTGLYAPAGEVIKVMMSEKDMDATGGISIHIGQALYNGQANNIWTAREFNRMPEILTNWSVNKSTATLEDGVYTAYIGSFLGGPIYIRDESNEYSVTISGGVNYKHYIYGVTTKEEFERLSTSSAPFFDLEVWESGVLHSGPKNAAAAFSYDDLTKAAQMWEKISSVSTKVTNQGIVFIYDPFVAAGAAVAFPGRRSVNCPVDWMSGSLNYSSFVSSGSWGNMHEYHHNFQGGWGFGYTGEVTNNALNLVSYSLFTKISSNRSIGNYGGSGLSGWNSYTSATWALNRVNKNDISSTNGLAVYATLLHNFGQDAFINSKASGANYLNKWAQTTHQDFGYYAGLVESYSGVAPSNLTATEYPAFVPVSSVYQTGRSYTYDGEKRYIETMQPYIIQAGKPFEVDLRPYTVNEANEYEYGSVVIGNGLSYKIKEVKADGINGTFEPTEENDVYLYTPTHKGDTSGKIYVTLEIVDEEGVLGGRAVDDVDLVLDFTLSHEATRFMLERTTYTYADGALPASAEDAFNSNYKGNKGKATTDNINGTQNSNTDVWLYEEGKQPNGANEVTVYKPNTVIEVSGKLYFPSEGKYRLVLRGRWKAALFVSLDGGKNYKLAAKMDKIDADNSANFSIANEDYYFDFDTSDITGEEERFLYFKSVLVSEKRGGRIGYMGLGYAQWQVPQYTTTTDEDGNVHYFDGSGKEVSAKEAENAEPIEPVLKNISYVTAYRQSYVRAKEFTSDYFYTKQYNYTYHDDDAVIYGDKSTLVINNEHKMDTRGWGRMQQYDINKMFDGNPSTNFVSAFNTISDDNPYYIYGDVGEQPITVNHINIVGSSITSINGYALGGNGMPLKFMLCVGNDPEKIDISSPILQVDEEKFTKLDKDFRFTNGYATFRYWCLVILKTPNNRVGINKVQFKAKEFDLTIDGGNGNQFSPDHYMFTYRGDWRMESADSKFGHVNVGKRNATMEFTFEGSRLIITSSKDFGTKFKVSIDGEYAYSEPLKKDNESSTFASFVSEGLSEGKHKVVIVCKKEANIESIAFSSDFTAHVDGGVNKRSALSVAWKVMLWLALAAAVALGIALLVFIIMDRKNEPAPAKGKSRAKKTDKKADKKKDKVSVSKSKAKPADAKKKDNKADKKAEKQAAKQTAAAQKAVAATTTQSQKKEEAKPTAKPAATATTRTAPAAQKPTTTPAKPATPATTRTTTSTVKPATTAATRTAPVTPTAARTTPAKPATPAAKATTPVKPVAPAAARTTTAARPTATTTVRTTTAAQKPAAPAARTATPVKPATTTAARTTTSTAKPATPAARTTAAKPTTTTDKSKK